MDDTDELLVQAEDILEHFGVKGMHWGVHSKTPGVSRGIDKMARKDAEEHARAKLYYGTGAGTRRKLINETVAARKKADPTYAKAFDSHREAQDLSMHASKAVSERNRTDRSERNKKRTGAIARRLTGEMGTQAAFVALTAGGIAYARSPKAQAFMKSRINDLKNSNARRQGARHISDIMRNFS